MPAATPPWAYLAAAGAAIATIAWLAIPAIWFTALPLTRPVRITGTLLAASAALSTALPLLGKHAAPAVAANQLLGSIALLAFVIALGRLFRLAATRRQAYHTAKTTADTQDRP